MKRDNAVLFWHFLEQGRVELCLGHCDPVFADQFLDFQLPFYVRWLIPVAIKQLNK